MALTKRLVIFDLDGTLLNTIGDLAASVNHALTACGFPTHPQEAYRFMVGSGIMKLFERALPEGERTPENIDLIRSLFIPYYEHHKADLTAPYDGVESLLATLQSRGVAVAVASNKYHAATQELVAHYFPNIDFCAVCGHREGAAVKPSPEIVWEIMRRVSVEPHEVLYVGDSDVDMLTAANAGVDAVGVSWGFRPREELAALAPRAIVDSAEEILGLL